MGYSCQQLVVLNTINGDRYARKLFPRKHQFDIKNSHLKPKAGTGLWTSTYTPHDDTPSDWYAWCTYNQVDWAGKEGILITVKRKARICTIDSYNDLESLLKQYPYYSDRLTNWNGNPKKFLNYMIMKKDFDIIHLTMKGHHDIHFTDTDYDLYGWDCECSLHLNNVIQAYKKVNL